MNLRTLRGAQTVLNALLIVGFSLSVYRTIAFEDQWANAALIVAWAVLLTALRIAEYYEGYQVGRARVHAEIWKKIQEEIDKEE